MTFGTAFQAPCVQEPEYRHLRFGVRVGLYRVLGSAASGECLRGLAVGLNGTIFGHM